MSFLKGKTAIITGAGRAVLSDGRCGSIGYGIATAYAKEGANIVITGRNVQKLQDAKEELERLYGIQVLTVAADVNAKADNKAVVAEVVRQTMEKFGRIDVLINNAQASASGVTLEDHTTEQFDLAIYSGLYAAFYYMQACYPHLVETKGTVINFASGAGLFGNFGQCAYAGGHPRHEPRGRHRVGAGRSERQHHLSAGLDGPAGGLCQSVSRGFQSQRENAARRPLRRCGTGNRPGVRATGLAGLQIYDRRNHHPGGWYGSAPVNIKVIYALKAASFHKGRL